MIRASYGIVWAIASIGAQPGDARISSMTGGGTSGPAVRKYDDGLAPSAGCDQLVEV